MNKDGTNDLCEMFSLSSLLLNYKPPHSHSRLAIDRSDDFGRMTKRFIFYLFFFLKKGQIDKVKTKKQSQFIFISHTVHKHNRAENKNKNEKKYIYKCKNVATFALGILLSLNNIFFLIHILYLLTYRLAFFRFIKSMISERESECVCFCVW